MTDAPDVVYMVRQGREYEELRYSLRSLQHIPHGRVWIYGARPRWLSDEAIHVPVPQGPVKHENTARILAAIAANRGLSPVWYWWHDDMYLLEPVAEVPRLYRCTWQEWTSEYGRDSWGPAKARATEEALAAHGRPCELSYELHIPMVVDRDVMRDMVAEVTGRDPDALVVCQKRSLYGNWVGYGGARAADVKFRRLGKSEPIPAGPWASSDDFAFDHSVAGIAVQNRLPAPSPYEVVRRMDQPDAVRLMAGHLADNRGYREASA